MKPVFISLILLIAAVGSFAQTSSPDVVFLKNGDRMSGEIIKYEQGKEVVLLMENGTKVNIEYDKVDKVVQGLGEKDEIPNEELLMNMPKEFFIPQTEGYYHITQLSFAVGSGDEEGIALGAGISSIFGYQLKPAIGIGLGIGLDNYARRGETVYPVFLDLRAYFPGDKKPWSYYATLNAGYGFAFARESIGITEAEGGYLVYPAVGFRTSTRQGVDVNIDLGMKFQKASFSRDLISGDIEQRELTFQRFAMRIGIGLWKTK